MVIGGELAVTGVLLIVLGHFHNLPGDDGEPQNDKNVVQEENQYVLIAWQDRPDRLPGVRVIDQGQACSQEGDGRY